MGSIKNRSSCEGALAGSRHHLKEKYRSVSEIAGQGFKMGQSEDGVALPAIFNGSAQDSPGG